MRSEHEPINPCEPIAWLSIHYKIYPIMFRFLIVLLLVFQMLVPTSAFARLLPAQTNSSNVPLQKVCPCSNKIGCHCCGCSDAPDEVQDTSTNTFPTKEPSSKNEKSLTAELRCKCHGPDSLDPEVDIFGHLRKEGWEFNNPPEVDLVLILADSWAYPFLPIEPHPPRK